MIVRPIWMDTILEREENVFEYSIEVDGTTIFKGKAYKRPNDMVNKIKVNKICENYLNNDINNMIAVLYNSPNGSYSTNYEGARLFQIKDKDGVVVEEYTFVYDWSYDERWANEMSSIMGNPNTGFVNISRPINNRYAAGMWQLGSTLRNEYMEGGINSGKLICFIQNTAYPVSPNIEDGCRGNYALYYINSYGGWDSFLFEGEVKKEDKIAQYTTDKTYNNTSIDFEMNRYISEIQTSYECNTGWLTDEQAANLAKNLLGTNKCYLHNLGENKIIPVIIEDTAAPYQTYSSNGNMMAQYKIKIKTSQTRIRR